MNSLQHYLTPAVKRFAVVSVTALILVTLIFFTSKRDPGYTPNSQNSSAAVVDLTGIPARELTLNRISAELERLQTQQSENQNLYQQELVNLRQEIRRLHEHEPSTKNTESSISESQPEPAPLPDVLDWNQFSQPPPTQSIPSGSFSAPPEPPIPIRAFGTSQSTPSFIPTHKPTKSAVLLRLPAGSLLSGQLITGLDVPTGQGVRREPYPVLIKIRSSAILPNRFRTNVRECFVLASGYGDLSSERAYLRSETLSCILKADDQEQVIERPLEGYVTGEDGKAGLRGRLVSKQGQVMAKAAMAGFLGGISDAFALKPVPVLSVLPNQNGQIQTPFQSGIHGSDALQSSLIKGSNKALEKLADFYLKLADQMVPVIEISAERSVDLILTRGLKP